jgi:DNA-binding NtrC family response regulator
LRALQEGEVDPVGSRKAVRTDFRLIAATNRRLIDLVSEGSFREDLFYRLNVFPVWIPPLRERMEDVPELTRHFTARFAAEEGRKAMTGPSAETLDMLMAYSWPGNIRQLENAVFRAVVLSDGITLKPEDFPQIVATVDPESARSRIVGASLAGSEREYAENHPDSADNMRRHDGAYPLHRHDGAGGTVRRDHERHRPPQYGTTSMFDKYGEIRRFEAIEEETIRFAVDHYRGRMSEVARRLGIGRSTLYRKLKDYGINTEDATAA